MSASHLNGQSTPRAAKHPTLIYRWGCRLMRAVFALTLRVRSRGMEHLAQPEGYVLACCHISHLDPFCLSALSPRAVSWMARIEFFTRDWAASALRVLGAFPVNRQGVPVSAIREALRRLAAGEVVGIFPEGEIKTGGESVLRGGPIKHGVCLLAARSGRPVVPCVLVGSEKLNSPGPWLPMLRGRLWVICGEPIAPIAGGRSRVARRLMAAQIERSFVALYGELRRVYELEETVVP